MSYYEPLMSEILMTDEQLKAIGILAAESAELESLLDKSIRIICRFTDEQEELFIGKWTIGVKIDAIKILVQPKLVSKIKLKKFEALFKKMKDSIARRNVIIHGNWTTSKPINWLGVMTLGIKSGPIDAIAISKKTKLTMKATEIMSIALRIHECHQELSNLYYDEILKRVKRRRTSLKKSP